MKRFIFAIIMFIAASTFAEEPSPGVRDEVVNLLKHLRSSAHLKTSPEEFTSFSTTVNEAEKLQIRGEYAEAEQLFSLALLKGKLLLEEKEGVTSVASIDSPPVRPVFTSMSSSTPIATSGRTSQSSAACRPQRWCSSPKRRRGKAG